MGRLFLLMFIVTAVEIYLLIKIGGIIGAIPTILLIFVTAGLGSWQLRAQGLSVFQKLQTLEGEPNKTLLEGVVLLVCAVLLITPGILTDVVGLLGLIPVVRMRLVEHLLKNSQRFFTKQMEQQAGQSGNRFFYYQSGGFNSHQQSQQQNSDKDNVFEGEFSEVEDNNLDKKD